MRKIGWPWLVCLSRTSDSHQLANWGTFWVTLASIQDLQASSPERSDLMADLAQAGYVTPDFLPSVLEREPCLRRTLTMPYSHPLQAHSHRSVLAITNLASPIGGAATLLNSSSSLGA